jgi:hypothetical protein
MVTQVGEFLAQSQILVVGRFPVIAMIGTYLTLFRATGDGFRPK